MSLPLSTGRLNIRLLGHQDWALFSDLYSDSEIMKHISEPTETVSLKQNFNRRLLPWQKDKADWHTLVIELAEATTASRQGIGLIGLRTENLETGIVAVNFILDMPHSGKGYATEALGAIVHYAFNTLNFNKISATCTTTNNSAQKALEANKFVKEGVLRNNSLVGEKLVDDCYYGLLVHEVTWKGQEQEKENGNFIDV